MAQFDFIDSAVKGYSTTWKNHFTFLRLAALPFFIKLGCFGIILFFGLETNYIRHGLIMLPAFFAEGFLFAYTIHTVLNGQKLIHDFKKINAHIRDIMAGTIIYVLTQLSLAVFAGSMMIGITAETANVQSQEPDPAMFFASITFLAFMIWAFRLIWLYVPASMGIDIKYFLAKIKPYKTSFHMLGCWLICFMPFAIGLLLLSQILSGFFPSNENQISPIFSILYATLQSATEIVIGLVSSLAMAYGVRQMMEDKS